MVTKNDQVGRSGKTLDKHVEMRKLFGMALTFTKNLRAGKYPHEKTLSKFVYVDLHAGCGVYPDGTIGSPQLFIDEAERLGEPYHAILCEVGAEQLMSLHSLYGRNPNVTVVGGDHMRTVESVRSVIQQVRGDRGIVYGLVLADPNGADVPVEVINQIASGFKGSRIDVAISTGATSFKRRDGQRLPGVLGGINKRYFKCFWDIGGKWQWQIWVASNWTNAGKSFPAGAHWMDSKGNQEDALLKAAFTSRERAVGLHLRIEPTASISVIPSSGRSERRSSPDQEVGANDAGLPQQLSLIT
jgi:hypothetical protein